MLGLAVMHRSGALVFFLASGCGARSGLDVPPDAAEDVATDVAADARDAGPLVDAPLDAPLPPPLLCPFPAQTELTNTTDSFIDHLVVDATSVYFHTWTGVWRAPKAGGTATLLASFQPVRWPSWTAFAVDSQAATFAARTATYGSTVSSVPLGGGAPTALATFPTDLMNGIIETPMLLAWAYDLAAPLDAIQGGVATSITALPRGTGRLVPSAGRLYGASLEGVFALAGTSVTFLTPMPGMMLDVDDTTVFFTQASDGPTSVQRVDKLAPSAPVSITAPASTDDAFMGIAASGGFVYVGTRSGSVLRVAKDGSFTAVIGSWNGQIIDVLVDGGCVYFTATNDASHGGTHVFVVPP